MRAVVQRVSRASVTVEGNVTGSIERGLLVFLGVGKEDTEKDITLIKESVQNVQKKARIVKEALIKRLK